ncbi:MAG: deoxynucleoside kinase [Candidatus Cloacimonetes bacterium]|nr:deoxynucleoside kinase [Candidatus Cloacimonadota bacterium]
MEHLRIGIIGNIGVGKSTLVEAASTEPLNEILLKTIPDKTGEEKIYAFKEKFNPKILDAFYADPVANAFVAQIEFFNGRLDRQKQIVSCKGIVLEDRTLAEDYYIFGLAQKILGNMKEEEFLAYQRTYNLMVEKVNHPDLIVYLKAGVPSLQKRIEQRGRESEKSIPGKYLQLLNELYEKFILRHAMCPVLTIDADNDSPLDEYLNLTFKKIAEKINELNLRVTTPGISEWVTLPETAATLKAIDAERKLEKYLKQNPKLIAVAGNVGLGKSTLAALMARSLNIGGLYEDPEQNPLLEKFLGNKAKYCFELQLFFLKMRAELQKKGKDDKRSFVMDRSLPEDLLVFCYQFQKDGYLTNNELDSLTAEFKKTSDRIPQTDLIILLKGNPDLAWSRIQQRGREMEIEGGWSRNEIKALSFWYESYAEDVGKFGFHQNGILEINVEKLDFTNRIHVGYIFEGILDKLTQAAK